jgi:hypothetical protein
MVKPKLNKMKNLFLISSLVFLLFSCSKEDEIELKFDINQYPQKWELKRILGTFPVFERTGDDMDWQEYILLNSDTTYTRYREQDELTTQVSGTCELKKLGETIRLLLNYESNNPFSGSCYRKNFESFSFQSETKLTGGCPFLDGAIYEYRRVE